MWTGNDNIHLLTADKRHQLRVDLYDWSRGYRYAKYDDFQVDDYRDKYQLYSLGKYSGNAGKWQSINQSINQSVNESVSHSALVAEAAELLQG